MQIQWTKESATLGRWTFAVMSAALLIGAAWLFFHLPTGDWVGMAIIGNIILASIVGSAICFALITSRGTTLTPRFVALAFLVSALLGLTTYTWKLRIESNVRQMDQQKAALMTMFESGQYKQSAEYKLMAERCRSAKTADECAAAMKEYAASFREPGPGDACRKEGEMVLLHGGDGITCTEGKYVVTMIGPSHSVGAPCFGPTGAYAKPDKFGMVCRDGKFRQAE